MFAPLSITNSAIITKLNRNYFFLFAEKSKKRRKFAWELSADYPERLGDSITVVRAAEVELVAVKTEHNQASTFATNHG